MNRKLLSALLLPFIAAPASAAEGGVGQLKSWADSVGAATAPVAGRVEWQRSFWARQAVVGVYNRAAGKIEWRRGNWDGQSVAGVYIPASKSVEWRWGNRAGEELAAASTHEGFETLSARSSVVVIKTK